MKNVVDLRHEQATPRVTSGRATGKPDTGGSITVSRVSLDTEGGKLSSAPSCGECLVECSGSMVDGAPKTPEHKRRSCPRWCRRDRWSTSLNHNVRLFSMKIRKPTKDVDLLMCIWD